MITIDPPIEKMTLIQRMQLMDELEASLERVEVGDEFSDEILTLLQQRKEAANRGEGRWLSIDEVRSNLLKRSK